MFLVGAFEVDSIEVHVNFSESSVFFRLNIRHQYKIAVEVNRPILSQRDAEMDTILLIKGVLLSTCHSLYCNYRRFTILLQ